MPAATFAVPVQGAGAEGDPAASEHPVLVAGKDGAGNKKEFLFDAGGNLLVSVNLDDAVILRPDSVDRNLVQPTDDAFHGLRISPHSPTQTAALQQWDAPAGFLPSQIDPHGSLGIRFDMTGATMGIAGGLNVSNYGNFETMFNMVSNNTFNGAYISCSPPDLNPIFFVGVPGAGNIFYCTTRNAGDIVFQCNGVTGQTADLFQASINVGFSDAPAKGFFNVDNLGDLRFERLTDTHQRIAARDQVTWADGADATRKGRRTLSAVDFNGDREGLRIEGDGAAARIGFLGAPAVVRQTNGTAAQLAAIVDPNVKAFLTALSNGVVNFGLFTAPA